MKKCITILLLLSLLAALAGCGQAAPTSLPETSTTAVPASTEAFPAKTVPSIEIEASFPMPGDMLTDEEMLDVWKTVIERMSEEDPTPEEALAKALSSVELLTACGEELLAHYPETPKWTTATFEVSIIRDDWIELWHERSKELIDFHSENCRILLEDPTFKSVTAAPGMVQFSLGGRGFGPETEYYDLYYIPSGDVSGCFGYSSRMTFTERDGGWFGRIDGDDTFFYREIGEHLYFCIAHF